MSQDDLFATPSWLDDAPAATPAPVAQVATLAQVAPPAPQPVTIAPTELRDTAPADVVVLACGDLHIDDRIALAGMAPTDRATGEPLVLAQARRTMAWIAEVARLAGADLILCGGDVYERPAPSNATKVVAERALVDLCEVAPTFVLVGNHDRPVGEGTHALETAKLLRPRRLRIIDTPAPLDLSPRGWPLRLYPIPYPSRSWLGLDAASPEQTAGAVTSALSALAGTFAADARQFDGQTALVAHATLRGAQYSDYQTVPLTDPQMSTDGWRAFDLAICAHLHQRQRAPGCPWSGDEAEFTHGYVGAPDRFDFGEAANRVGVSVLRLRGGAWSCEFVENPHARQFVSIDVGTLDGSPEALAARVSADDQRQVYRVVGAADEATADRVNAAIRRLKHAGVVIRGALDIERSTRARIGGVRLDGGVTATLDAVFAADESLRPHETFIRETAGSLEGAGR